MTCHKWAGRAAHFKWAVKVSAVLCVGPSLNTCTQTRVQEFGQQARGLAMSRRIAGTALTVMATSSISIAVRVGEKSCQYMPTYLGHRRSGQNAFYHVAKYKSEARVLSLVLHRKPLVIDTQQVEHGGVEIVDASTGFSTAA